MKLLLIYWSFMAAAYIIAARLRRTEFDFSWVSKAMTITIYVLCLIMGLRMGINEEVTSSLGSIGVMSLIVTVCCVAGSMLAVFATRKLFGMDRFGNLPGEGAKPPQGAAHMQAAGEESEASGESHEEPDNKMQNIITTVIILAVVAGGMVAGALIIAPMGAEAVDSFDSKSSTGLVILLCILLFFVGFELGSHGGVFDSLKKAGLRVLAFPIAAILGTVILGVASCMILGFSVKEGLAICLGFGWYTYAPVVIAEAGKQYIVASAVSFMHNVIREMAGIILIPLLARRFGYLESTSVPGVAAMDVCMPIVERSCRQDTVIYSFATGLVMCLATSVGVPLVMG